MAKTTNDHLARARIALSIAESGDSKREAYKTVAEEVAAAQDEGASQRTVATVLGKSQAFVEALVSWRKSGYKADTPWLADTKATARAAKSHTKKVLAEATPDEIHSVLSALPEKQVKKIRDQATEVQLQKHPATAKKPPLKLPEPKKYPFLDGDGRAVGAQT